MRIQILSLDGILYEGDVSQASLPTKDGEITVLKNHIPLITLLKKGEIKTSDKNITIEGGFAEITGEKVVVLVN